MDKLSVCSIRNLIKYQNNKTECFAYFSDFFIQLNKNQFYVSLAKKIN